MGKVFKKSLMGFSKEQVIAYIDTLVDKQKAALEEEKEKYAQLQEENEKLTNERDNAVTAAREELQGEIDALNEQIEAAKGEKDEIFIQLEDMKAENQKLSGEKNELFESIKSIKSQLNEYINNEKASKERLEGLENENKALTAALEREKSISAIDISTYQAEIEKLRAENAGLKAQFRTKTVVPAAQPKEENTEEVWESLKDKINGLATDFNDLANSVRAEETRENESKKISIKDILERVKRIGEKI